MVFAVGVCECGKIKPKTSNCTSSSLYLIVGDCHKHLRFTLFSALFLFCTDCWWCSASRSCLKCHQLNTEREIKHKSISANLQHSLIRPDVTGWALMSVCCCPSGHTPALACAPNKDVADCLALILSTMKPFPQRDPSSCSCSSPTVSPSPGLNLLKHCGITAACAPLPSNGLHNGYVKDRHGAPVGLDGCLSEWGFHHHHHQGATPFNVAQRTRRAAHMSDLCVYVFVRQCTRECWSSLEVQSNLICN